MLNLLRLGKEEEIKKGSHLLWKGERCKHLFFVKEGMLRVYYNKADHEVTDWFGTEGSFVTVMDSFHEQRPSDQFIQAIQRSIIIRISRMDLEKELKSSMSLKDEYLNVVTNHLVRVQQRIKALQFYTAKERYDLLISKNPSVVKYAQRNQIASYLGVSLETLSRVTKSAII